MRSAKLGNHIKPFFLKCIFELMINTAPQGSGSVNGREEYFNCINFKKQTVQWSHGPVVRGITFCTKVSWGAGLHPVVVLFFFHHIFPLWLVSVYSHCMTLFCFVRFLR